MKSTLRRYTCAICMLAFLFVSQSGCGTLEVGVEHSPTVESPTVESSSAEPPVPTSTPPAVPASPEPTPDLSPPRVTAGNAGRVAGLVRLGRGIVWDMALDASGRTLAVATTAGVELYDLPTLEFARLLEGHMGQLFSVSWSPDGMWVAAGSGYNTIYIWNSVSGDLSRTLEDPDGVEQVAWSPDGTFLASRTRDGAVRVWDAGGGQLLHTWEREADCFRVDLAWLPDGSRLAAGCRYTDGDGKVTVWDVATRQAVRVLDRTTGIHRAAWSPDGALLASGCPDGAVRVWDGQSGEELYALRDLSGQVGSVAWSSDGARLAWIGPDGRIQVWDYATEPESRTLQNMASGYRNVLWSPDNTRLVSAPEGVPGALQLWDVASGAELAAVDYGFVPTGLAWSPDATRVAVSSADGGLYVWDIAAGSPLYVERLQAAIVPNVQTVVWSPDGAHLATANTDNTVRLWEAASGRQVRIMDSRGPMTGLAWSPDSRFLASWGDTTVRVWEAASGNEVHPLDHSDITIGLAWSPAGTRLATVSNDGQVTAWDPAAGTVILALRAQIGPTHQVRWSPDGTKLAAISDPGLVIWDSATGNELLAREGDNLYTAAWSPDGTRLAAGTDFGKLVVWDAASGRLVHTLGCGSSVLDLAWSPDGALLASASDRIRIWDAAEGRVVAALEGHAGLVERVVWSPDGALLASMGSDLAIRVWGVPRN
jgi:WD40 repeat protein